MRDYKHVKVPRAYRTSSSRASVKRVEVSPARRGKKGGSMKGSLLAVFMVLAAAGGGWLAWEGYRQLTQAAVFQVSGVDVKGVRHMDDAELAAIVGPFRGQNIFRADLESAVQRARQNPWIKEVRIHRSLPNRISMAVVERIPYAVLDTASGRYLIDSDSVVIEREQKEEAGSRPLLPMIAAGNCRPRPGDRVLLEGVEEGLAILAEIQARGGWNLGDVTVRAGSADAMSVVYGEYEFKFGSGRYEEKLRRLSEIMADVKARGLVIAYVDLRPETQAAVMVKQPLVPKAAPKTAGKNAGGKRQAGAGVKANRGGAKARSAARD